MWFKTKEGVEYRVNDKFIGNKMTRQHAHELVFGKCKNWEGKEVAVFLDALEALGLLKFEEPKKIEKSIKLNEDNYFGDYGTIRIETWPEGLVLWVGGEIVYRSWKI